MSALTIVMMACGGQTTTPPAEEHEASDDAKLTLKLPYDNIKDIKSREEFNRYVAEYWNDFRFDIGEEVERYSEEEITTAFAKYVMIIPRDKADSLLRCLMHRAESSVEVLDLFSDIAHTVLYDPNSPARNDEYYIPILEVLAQSPLLDEYDRMIPRHTLKIVKQNRVGNKANNFRFKMANGSSGTLYDIKADYTILLFNNPGCEMCKMLIDDISTSEMLKSLGNRYNIVTLAIYPDEDIEAWHDYLPNMPKEWICGYDEGMVISNDNLYDLKAIPSLYLLDKNKNVLIKDGVDIRHVEEIISRGIEL